MTPARLHRLRSLVDDGGRLRVLALDHRDSLRVEFEPDDPGSVAAATVVDFKRDVLAGFASAGAQPTGVMLDPEYAVPALLDGGAALAGASPESDAAIATAQGFPVICALEAQGYFDEPDAGNRWLDGWDPARLVGLEVSAAKLLVLYRPDASTASAQEALVARTIEACGAVDLPLFVEPVPFDVVDPADRLACVVGAAERFVALDPDGVMVLKAPFPGSPGGTDAEWHEACRALDAVCGATPWATLSWGSGLDEFARQLAVACANGCSGFLAGRAIWRPALDAAERSERIAAEAVPAFERLDRIVDDAPSLFDRLPDGGAVDRAVAADIGPPPASPPPVSSPRAAPAPNPGVRP